MLDRRFTTLFIAVTGLLGVAVYMSGQAAARGGLLLIALAATSAVVAVLGFLVLARVVVLVERQRRAR